MTMLVIIILIAMTMNNKLNWPQDYETWTGGFDDLVATSTQILNDICPDAGAPTTSLVRYYQQQGAVGRGKREGRGSTFSFSELAQVVASKQMVSQQVPLSIAKEVMSNSSIDTIYGESNMHHAYHSLSNTPAAAASTVMLRTDTKAVNPAEQLVAKLMSQSNSAPRVGAMSALQRGFSGQVGAMTSSLSMQASTVSAPTLPPPYIPAIPPGGVLRYSLSNGVSVEIPADQYDRQLQAQTLRAFADQLDPPHTTWSQP
jgi:hypothetical protein